MKKLALIIAFASCALTAWGAAPAWPDFGDDDVLLLEDGRQFKGKFIKAAAGDVFFRWQNRERAHPKEDILALSLARKRAGAESLWSTAENTADGWFWMGVALARKQLGVEAVICYRHAIILDPEHSRSRRVLGHAKLDGKWLKRHEVKEKLKSGFVLDDGKLVKGDSAAGRTSVKPPDKTIEKSLHFISPMKLTDRQLKDFDKERANRKQDFEAFKKNLQKDYQGLPWSNRHVIQSRHFTIECNCTRKTALRYGKIMDSLFNVLTKRFPAYRLGNTSRPIVYIYRNADDFRDKTGMFYGVGGFYVPTSGHLYTYHGTFGMTQTTFNVLAHEGTHQFQGKVLQSFKNVPIWIIEGLAVYFGDGARLKEDGSISTGVIPRDRLLHIQDKIKESKQDSLTKLVTLEHRQFSGTHYADAWALVYFLVHSDKKGQDLLSQYWNIATKRKIRIDDFNKLAEIHSGSLSALETKYIEFIKKLKPDPAGELRGDFYYSGDFCFEFRKLAPAWRFYEKNEGGFLVGQLAPDGNSRVEVTFKNNDERAQSGDDYIKQFITNYADRVLPALYNNVKADRVKIHDVEAFRFTYEDDPKKTSLSGLTSGISIDALQEMMRKLEKNRKKEGGNRKYMEYLIVDVDGTFSIKGSAKKDAFAKHQETFLKIPVYFEPIHQRRW